MSLDPHALKLYLDSSRLGKRGSEGGFVVRVEYPSAWSRTDQVVDEISFRESTSNRTELQACIWAQRWLREQTLTRRVERIQIFTDSKYIHDHWRKAEHWRANQWRGSDGNPIENSDLWKEFLSIRGKMRVRTDIEWPVAE